MPRTHTPYPAEYRQQILELAHAGRSAEDLAREFEPTPQEKERLQRQIEATDRVIDMLVYGLYGLSEDEIRIVEEG